MRLLRILSSLAFLASCAAPTRSETTIVVNVGSHPLAHVAGHADADGRFTLKTFENGDGAVLGTHPVMILAAEQLSPRKQRWHAPKKYANPKTSGLTAAIDGPTDSLLIELSWEGGKPFVEIIDQGE